MKYVIEAITLDEKNVFRTVPKVTKKHLFPNTFQRMKVSLAAQLMSHSVASLMLHCVSTGALPNDALATAVFIKTVDELFNSFNASKSFPENGKEIKTADTSPHLDFWEKMEKTIGGWQFVGYR